MSQNGAGRWARGSTSYRCDPAPAACPSASIPHERWPVTWQDEKQILTHYYTGIQIRDQNSVQQTPNQRWWPLWLSRNVSSDDPWRICTGSPNAITFLIQNSGTISWLPAGQYHFSFRPSWRIVSTRQEKEPQGLSDSVAIGGVITERVTIELSENIAAGNYTVDFDMQYYPNYPNSLDFEWFSDQTPSWPYYSIPVKVTGPCRVVYLPVIQSNRLTHSTAEPIHPD